MTYNVGMKYVVCIGVHSHLVVLLLSLATAAEVLVTRIFGDSVFERSYSSKFW
jgi:hypothetical protein